jgi:trans-AT polyketide synthase/acyltransferase/oxidoreductase domain-containing protein
VTRIYLFPGQGSQKVGMGEGLFSRFPAQVAEADAVLGYSVAELCLRDPANQLNLTTFTQPALFVVNALFFLDRLVQTGELPQIVAGHSLGEYNALFAAGVFDFRTGLSLVRERARVMGRESGGAMAAVIGLTEKQIRQVLTDASLLGIDIANLNSPGQTVISGPESEIIAAQSWLEKAGAQLYRRLSVSAAFHSRYMARAEQEFRRFLQPITFTEPKIPVLSNVTARPHASSDLASNLASQLTHPVRWTESIQWLLQGGDPHFVEVGPGNVLTGLLRRIRMELPVSEPALNREP